MDSIDFNSYLDPEIDAIKKNEGYILYIKQTETASKTLDKILNKIDGAVNKKAFKLDPENKYELTQWLVLKLFEAKKERLIAKILIGKNEQNQYYSVTNKLYLAFDKIPERHFKGTLKGQSFLKSFHWAKILYYNELAICYSGLIKSSMSLGYAEQSISLLEGLHFKLKNIENENVDEREKILEKIETEENPLKFHRIIKLYTCALYNYGEAQRLLHNEELALKTFQRIIEIFKKWEEIAPNCPKSKHSDYIDALMRKGMILADMGRGCEAIKVFKEIINEVDDDDYRRWNARLEESISYIDGKEYEQAFNDLKWIKEHQSDNTFIFRKAQISAVRLLNEFKKNRPRDFAIKTKTDLAQKIENESNFIIKSPERILQKTIIRQDGDNFKKTCIYLANYLLTMGKEEDNSEKNADDALKFFYLFLFYRDFFEVGTRSISQKNLVIEEWINDEIWNLLKINIKEYHFLDVLDRVDEENYLKDFFDLYIKISERKEEKVACSKDSKDIVKKLKDRLVHIYSQKENTISLERIEDQYNHFEGNCSKKVDNPQTNNATEFIKKYFFEVGTENNPGFENFLLHDSIVQKMKSNTQDFISKVVGNSEFPNEQKEEIVGRLNVLRRWNSFTPALRSPVNQSKGGGYFIYLGSPGKSLGIVIDPGYNFLENFFSQGFRIGDIDIILVSHAHPDHTDNLPHILSLFHEMNGRLGDSHNEKNRDEKKRNKKALTLVLSPGVFEHYNHIMKPSEEHLKDIIVMDMKEGNIETAYNSDDFRDSFSKRYEVEIKAFGTSHKDLSSNKSQSLGFKIIIDNKINGAKSVIGYTGDAKWSKLQNWSKHFSDCTIICAHLGSIVNILEEKDFCKTFCDNSEKCNDYEYVRDDCKRSGYNKVNVLTNKLEKQTQEENHLYLSGLTSFFDDICSKKETNLTLNLKLAVISEFGEELKDGIRIDLSRKLDSWFSTKFEDWTRTKNCKEIYPPPEKTKCLPGDIGLEIDIFSGRVYCHCCKRFVDRDKIYPIPYGREEAIFFVCKECKSVLSSYQIGEKLKDYYENGRKLELANES